MDYEKFVKTEMLYNDYKQEYHSTELGDAIFHQFCLINIADDTRKVKDFLMKFASRDKEMVSKIEKFLDNSYMSKTLKLEENVDVLR